MRALFDSWAYGFDFILKLNTHYSIVCIWYLVILGISSPLIRGIYLYNMPIFVIGFCITLPCLLLCSFSVRRKLRRQVPLNLIIYRKDQAPNCKRMYNATVDLLIKWTIFLCNHLLIRIPIIGCVPYRERKVVESAYSE